MSALTKFTWVELKLFVREPLTVVFSLAFPIIVLFVLAQVFGNTPDPEGKMYRGVGAIDFYVPAYIGLAIASVGLVGIPVHLAGYREAGILRRFRASSVSIWVVFGSQIVVAFVIAATSSLLMILVTFLAFDMNRPHFLLGVVAAFLLGALSFTALGFLLGALLPTPRTAQLAGLILFFVMMLVSGGGPPRELLGAALQRVGDAMPLTHVTVLLQDPWLGFGWNAAESLLVAGIMVAAAALSAKVFRWE